MREDKSSYAIPIAYDRRFINEEQVTAVTNFFSAIQNQGNLSVHVLQHMESGRRSLSGIDV